MTEAKLLKRLAAMKADWPPFEQGLASYPEARRTVLWLIGQLEARLTPSAASARPNKPVARGVK